MAMDDPTEVKNWVRERVLGSGGFGEVTLWKHKSEDAMIALKKCRTGTDTILSKKSKERWSKEVEIMQRLDHPNVVKAVTVPPELSVLRSELPLMCMEYCSKGDLRQVLNRSENCCGLPESDVRCLISDVKSAVQYLHSMKITHRDLKPENIVLQPETNGIVYKLIDLGYAKELDQSSICTSFVGTLQYLAPELFMSKSYNYSVDYWSLGLVSHEVITGVRPFLPNLTPAAWMKHVREKSSDDICAYQAQDGNIVFSKELYPQNHINSCLKYHMERWLKHLLEWDASKRGRANGAKSDIVVFNLIDEIFHKKIVNLFFVPKYKNLSYEIDDSTAVSTLQLWIERDTGLSVQDQELLLPTGHTFDPVKQACQCWVPPDVSKQQTSGVMAYVFQRGSLKVEQSKPLFPPTVEKMMEEPRDPVEYVHQKRAWAHAVFFLQQEMDLYNSFLLAYRAKLLSVFSSSNRLIKQNRSVFTQLQQVGAQFQFCLDSLRFDEEHAKRYGLSVELVSSWTRIFDALNSQFNRLKDAVQQLDRKCEAVNIKTVELQRSSSIKTRESKPLVTLYEDGVRCYDGLRRRPKETRQKQRDNVDMVKVVYNCLKQRDKLLREKEFNQHLSQVVTIQEEIEQLTTPLNKALQVMNKLQKDLRQMQLDRQGDIWQKMAPGVHNGFTVPSVSMTITKPQVPPHGIPQPSKEREPTPVFNSSIDSNQNSTPPTAAKSSLSLTEVPEQTPILDNAASLVLPQPDLSAMIQDNIALRYATQDMMNSSYQQFRRFMSEDQTLDWAFLETEG